MKRVVPVTDASTHAGFDDPTVCAICLGSVGEESCQVCSCKLHHSCQKRWPAKCPVCCHATREPAPMSNAHQSVSCRIVVMVPSMIQSAEPYTRRWMRGLMATCCFWTRTTGWLSGAATVGGKSGSTSSSNEALNQIGVKNDEI